MSTEPANLSPTQPLNSDLAGYPSVDALVAGYRASSDEGKKQRDRADKLEALASQLLTSAQAAPNARQNVPDRSRAPEDRLTEFGVPVDALGEYVERAIAKRFEPLTNGMQARGRVVADHPDYVKFENDVAQFIATDPELSHQYPKMFEAAPQAALEYAFLKFGDSRRRAFDNTSQNGTREGVGDAAIPSSRAGEGRREPDTSRELQQAYENFQKSGSTKDATAYAKLRLRSVITDEFLNQ